MKIFTFFSQAIGIFLLFVFCINTAYTQDLLKIYWHKDLDYLKNELPMMHGNLLFQYPQAAYDIDIEEFRKQIDLISDETMFIKIMQLLVKL